MTLEELRIRVRKIIHDSSVGVAELTDILNQGQREVAGRVLLPELATSNSETQTGSNAYVALPTDYQRNLFHVVSDATDWPIEIEWSWNRFLLRYPKLDDEGSVDTVCVRGRRLYYQDIPASGSEETFTLHYYKYPTAMTDDDHQPEGIPQEFHEVLVNYAVKEILAYRGGEAPLDFGVANQLYMESLNQMITALGPEDLRARFAEDQGLYAF